MNRFFDASSPLAFVAYSPAHLAALALFAALVVLLFVFRGRLRENGASRWGRWTLAGLLVLSELSLNVWYLAERVYDPKDTLPLELCSISLYVCIAMLLSNRESLFRFVYFTGIGGAAQALLTPALFYGFPHFRFVEFFAAHMLIILSVLYMIWVERMRPTLKSVFTTFGLLNGVLLIVFFINWVTGGNYMFLARKPETASLLDFLGPYPFYLLSMEAVALVIFLLLYLPFAFVPARKTERRSDRSDNSMS